MVRKLTLEQRIARLERMVRSSLVTEATKPARKHVKNEEAYAPGAEGELAKLYDMILDCKDAADNITDPIATKSLSRASKALDMALDKVGDALNTVQMQ